MSDKPQKPSKITPYLPFYRRDGNVVIKEWETLEHTRNGVPHRVKWVRYKDKKNKEAEVVKQVIWLADPFAYVNGLYGAKA